MGLTRLGNQTSRPLGEAFVGAVRGPLVLGTFLAK